MRDGLSLLDQAIAYGGGEVKEADVRAMLGSVDKQYVYDLMQALADRDSTALLTGIEQLASHAADFTNVLNEVLSVLHRVALSQLAPGAIDDQLPEKPRLDQLAQTLTPEDTQLYYQIGLISKRDLPLAPDPKLGFEMAMLRMLRFRPDTGVANPTAAGQSAGHAASSAPTTSATPSSSGAAPTPTPSAPAQQTKAHHLQAISKTLGTATTKKKLNNKDHRAQTAAPAQSTNPASTTQINNVPAKKAPTSTNKDAPAAPAAETTRAAPVTGPLPLPTDHSTWESLVERLPVSGVPLQLARNCSFACCGDGHLELQLFEGHQQFFSKQRQEILANAIGEATGKDIKLSIDISVEAGETPAGRQQQRNRDRQQSAEQSIYNDAIVKSIIETFEGRIPPKSIQPID
jgi:DNA polymerase-3 subunit gamma/tau